MRIDIITIFPDVLKTWLNFSIMKRAQSKKKVQFFFHDIRAFSDTKHKNVDDYPYGGKGGMVMCAPVIGRCIDSLLEKRKYDEIIYLCPDAPLLTQKTSNSLSIKENIIILCGHYKGVDQRIRDAYITLEISIGDYVITGGELAAAVLIDSMVRLVPGVVSNTNAVLFDSMQDNLLEAPIYTRPVKWKGRQVPRILLSGNQKDIEAWKLEQSIIKTKKKKAYFFKPSKEV